MSQKRLLYALGCAAAAVALTAAPAQAQPPETHFQTVKERLGANSTESFPLARAKGTKNWKILVSGFKNSVTVDVLKKGQLAYYSARGKATPTRLRANFGKFGKVNLRFVKKGKLRKQKPRGCTGTPNKIQRGVWRGILRFKGEGSYTKVRVKSAKGSVMKPGRLDCSSGGNGNGGGHDYVTLQASKDRPKDRVHFFAEKRAGAPNARPWFTASTDEKKGKVSIGRMVSVRGKPNQFKYTLTGQAEVKPKGKFSGRASLDGSDWTGNLKVKLPGKRVALTGPGFQALLTVPIT